MLLDAQSYALDYKEHASRPYRAMLPMKRSTAPVADDEDLKFRKAMLSNRWKDAASSPLLLGGGVRGGREE